MVGVLKVLCISIQFLVRCVYRDSAWLSQLLTLASLLTSAEENFRRLQLLLALEPAGHYLPFRHLPGREIHLSLVQGQPPSPAVSHCSFIKFYI